MDRPRKLEQDSPSAGFGSSSCNETERGWSLSRSSETSSDQSQPQRLSRSMSENKVCRICGDRALSVNFNVVSCESCKAFFRRNALKPKEFRCPFSGSCEITMASRKFCKKCRLKKCFDVGMMKEWIMTEEARLQKRQLIESNREKRKRLFMMNAPPSKIRRKSSKVEIFDSPPATSSSMSSEERQPDTPPFSNGVITPTKGDVTCEWINTNGRGADAGLSVSNPLGSTAGSGFMNADSITIPKSVLLNLINRCQQNSQNACPRCPPPPILARALRLYEFGGLDGLEKADDGSSGATSSSLFLKCICSCTCGARPPSIPSGVGLDKMEKGVDAMDTTAVGEESQLASEATLVPRTDTAQSSTSAFRQIDNRVSESQNIENSGGYSTSGLEMVLAPAPASAFQSFSADAGVMNVYGIHELGRARRVLDRVAADLGYSSAPAHQEHMRYVIRDPMEAVKATHFYIRRIVDMHRTLSTFRSLPSSDQAALLQDGMREQMMLQSVSHYNHEIDAWLPFGRSQPYLIRLELLNSLNAELFDPHVNFIRSFAPQWSSDETLMQLVAAVNLFDPNRRGIVDTEAVARQQQFYYGLMKQYLMKLYGTQEGLRIFGELNNRLHWLRRDVDRMQPRYHLELSPQDLHPLMIELLF